jgi:hypothetical protein
MWTLRQLRSQGSRRSRLNFLLLTGSTGQGWLDAMAISAFSQFDRERSRVATRMAFFS